MTEINLINDSYQHWKSKKQITMQKDFAYFFYYNKIYYKGNKPLIIVERPVKIKNGIYYNKLFKDQWEYYKPVDNNKITIADVIFDKVDGYVILNGKVYQDIRIQPNKLKEIIKGYKQLTIFDFI